MIWLYIVIAAVVLLVIYAIVIRNRMIRAENQVDNAWSQIDVQLQRRGELIPNVIETVKGYAKHEKETLDAVIKARGNMLSATTREGKMAQEGILEQALGKLFAIAEAYPDLKANTNFLKLQEELAHTENKVAFSRQAYNDSITFFNNLIETFPGSLFRGGRKEKAQLAVPEHTKALPKVAF
ncbi:MAG: LemA family protein [Candidatus Thermoplasmatota archaeon]